MRRRRYLALSCTALTLTVAGCSSNGDDTTDDGGVQDDDSQTPTPVDENLQSFQTALADAGFEVDVLELRDGNLTLDYFTTAENDDDIIDEAESILAALADELEDGWDVDSLDAFLLDADEQMYAYYRVESDRVGAWRNGDVSDEEFFGEIRENITHG